MQTSNRKNSKRDSPGGLGDRSDCDEPLFIRADANARIGAGHVMRCLALAQAWQDDVGRVCFVTQSMGGIADRLQRERCDVHALEASIPSLDDARQTAAVAFNEGARWVVVDGYSFDLSYQNELRDKGLRVLCLDDYSQIGSYSADLLLDQNLGATAEDYAGLSGNTQTLLGSSYAMLRREFRQLEPPSLKTPDRASRGLVTFGGADPTGMTARVIEAVAAAEFAPLELVVLVGAANPNGRQIESLSQTDGVTIRIVRDTSDMPQVMSWADVAISAAGSTSWELAYMGLPSLVLAVAENQRRIASGLDDASVALSLGWHETCTADHIASQLARLTTDKGLRETMSRNGRRLIDGQGARRVVDAMVRYTTA